MQRSDVVLYNLSKQAQRGDVQFDRLYRLFYNEDVYRTAYQHVYGNENVERFCAEIPTWVGLMREERYQPTKLTERSSTIPVIDRVVREMCRMVLSAIYEPMFIESSHAFRPGRDCHTALTDVKKTFTNITWVLDGEFERSARMNGHVLIERIRKRVRDEKFIRLLWKLLKSEGDAGWGAIQPYSGAPDGVELHQLLWNVYLDEWDRKVVRMLQPIHKQQGDDTSVPYVRYANRFLIGVRGSKTDVMHLQRQLGQIASECVQLPFTGGDMTLRHHTRNVLFLGYELQVGAKPSEPTRLRIPKGALERFLTERKLVKDINAKEWRMLHRPGLVRLPAAAIVSRYNAEMNDWYTYYRLAENVNPKMWQLCHVMEYSCLKTLAHKYRSSVREIKTRFRDGKRWGVPDERVPGRIRYFEKGGFDQAMGAERSAPRR